MKIAIENGVYQGIPYKTYAHPEPERLIFINHGVFGNKERVLTLFGSQLAKIGYKVVAIDASRHGERGESPFSPRDEEEAFKHIFDVVKETSEDILLMYHALYEKDYSDFDILGLSMGGYVAYHMTTITDHVKTLVTMISSPDFLPGAKNRGIDPRTLRTIESMNPASNVSKMRFKHGLALVGEYDEAIKKTETFGFLEKNPDLPLEARTYHTGHQATQAMQEDTLEFLRQKAFEEGNK
ncbi:MAG: serine aminopeptidase domain-containing protein [Bacillota bacterium]